MSAASKNSFRPNLEALEDRSVPAVTWHQGYVLPHVMEQNLYLGSQWSTAGGVQSAKYLLGFSNMLVNSNYMDDMTRAGYGVGRGTALAGSILNYNLGSRVTDGQIQYAVQQAITAGHAYYTGPNMLYVVFVQPHVAVQAAQGETSASGVFAGYHSYFLGWDATGHQHYIPYAVIPYPGNGANPTPQTYGYPNEAAEITDVASHEIAESVTDPYLNGWYDNRLGEIGDITNNFHQSLNGYNVQLLSNKADQPMIVSNSPIYYVGSSGAFVSTDGVHYSRIILPYDHLPVVATSSPGTDQSMAQEHTLPFDVFGAAVTELSSRRYGTRPVL